MNEYTEWRKSMKFDEQQVAGPQKAMMISAMKEYFNLSPEQIKKYVTPFSEIFMENNCTGSNLDVYCSCGWSGTLPHGKDSSFYTNFRCPKCKQTSKIQKINGLEFDFGTPSTLMMTHAKNVVCLEKANLPNDAILIRYFTVYYLPTTNIGKKTINQQIYEYQRIFVTENQTFIFNKNKLTPAGHKEWCLVQNPLPNRSTWCFQTESQIKKLKALPSADCGFLDCWTIPTTMRPIKSFMNPGNIEVLYEMKKIKSAKWLLDNGYIEFFKNVINKATRSTDNFDSRNEISQADKAFLTELSNFFSKESISKEHFCDAKTFCCGDASLISYYAQAYRGKYSLGVYRFAHENCKSIKSVMEMTEKVSRMCFVRRFEAVEILENYVDACMAASIEPDLSNFKDILHETTFAKTVAYIFAMYDCDPDRPEDMKDLYEYVSEGFSILPLEKHAKFAEALKTNRNKQFVKRFFSEILDEDIFFRDLKEKKIYLVMKGSYLKKIVVFAIDETKKKKVKVEYVNNEEQTGG